MPETCKVLYQNKIGIINASGWLFEKKSVAMHGNVNVKFKLAQYVENSLFVKQVCTI
jgi:hypothetical protein